AFPVSGYNNTLLIGFGLMENYFKVDGQIHYARYEPALLDYLTVMHDWYEKGYISKDFTAADPQALFEAQLAGSFIFTSVDTFTRCAALDIPVQNAPYIRQEEGQQLHGFYSIWPDNTVYTNISAKSPYIKEAMMFINFGYTEEGANVYNYGKPGMAWTPDEGGQPIYTDYILNNPTWNVNELSHILKLHSGGISRMRYSDSFTIPDNAKNPACLAYRLQWMDDPNYDTETNLPPFKYTVEANDRHTALITDIKTYADEMILKFITGAEPLSGFDNYRATLKSMGVEEAIALTQEAYEAHMAK
ncbi:MAG TPA: hypothetical protein PKE04_12505, partial [Clostridia bacterium]|nr:hypothetical protein [Clostridia bacterium]